MSFVPKKSTCKRWKYHEFKKSSQTSTSCRVLQEDFFDDQRYTHIITFLAMIVIPKRWCITLASFATSVTTFTHLLYAMPLPFDFIKLHLAVSNNKKGQMVASEVMVLYRGQRVNGLR